MNIKKTAFVILLSAVVMYTMPLTSAELLYGVSACTVTGDFFPALNTSPPYVVAIDPGHGGMDTGAQSIVDEIKVIDMTAAYLYEFLENDPDFIPVYTRTSTDPESSQRAHTANTAGASLLISIHANSDSHRSSHGFECFPTPPGRTHHTESLKFATLLAAEMKSAGHTLRGGEEKTGVKYAYYSGNNKKIVDSTDQKVRSLPSFGILEKTNCPAVLVEQCFITNYEDVSDWTGETGCSKAAQVYYTAIKQYFARNTAENSGTV